MPALTACRLNRDIRDIPVSSASRHPAYITWVILPDNGRVVQSTRLELPRLRDHQLRSKPQKINAAPAKTRQFLAEYECAEKERGDRHQKGMPRRLRGPQPR
jgi:hypothetical protein